MSGGLPAGRLGSLDTLHALLLGPSAEAHVGGFAGVLGGLDVGGRSSEWFFLFCLEPFEVSFVVFWCLNNSENTQNLSTFKSVFCSVF